MLPTYHVAYVRHELLHYRLSSRKFIECAIKIQEDNLKIKIRVINITKLCNLYRILNIIRVLESKSSNWDENIKRKREYRKLILALWNQKEHTVIH